MSGVSYSLFQTRHYVLSCYFIPLFSSHSVSCHWCTNRQPLPAQSDPTLSRTPVCTQTSSYRTSSAGTLGDQTVIPSDIAAEVECQASDTALRYDALPWCQSTRWGRVLPSFGLTSVIWLVCVQGMNRPGSDTTHQLMARLSLTQ